MNKTYLMKYVSLNLHTPVRRYDLSRRLTDSFCGRPDFNDHALAEAALSCCGKVMSSLPFLFTLNTELCYSQIPDGDGFFLVGPVRFSQPILLIHRFQSDLRGKYQPADIPLCDFQELLRCILLIYNLCHDNELKANDLIMHCCVPAGSEAEPLRAWSRLVFQNQEDGRRHNPYSQEFREQNSIETGDPVLLKKSIEEDYLGEIGTLSKDFLRNWKYLAVVNITLASRSAIRGGLAPEIAYSLSDTYIQKVDESSSQPHIQHLMRSAEFQYAGMVQELKAFRDRKITKENPYIEQCKDYVFSHLHDNLTVADIADHLCLNANYLSELFHEYEGITLKTYILLEKVKLAKNLLTYSQYTYGEIAVYLGFSSQSHLGKVFKAATGYTLGRYRKEFGSPEFITSPPGKFREP